MKRNNCHRSLAEQQSRDYSSSWATSLSASQRVTLLTDSMTSRHPILPVGRINDVVHH